MGARYSTPSKLSREFNTQKIIGHGAFGVVLQSTHEFDKVAYAIKLIKLPGPKEDAEKVLREAKNYAMIPSHQNIVSYKSSWLDTINKNELADLVEAVARLKMRYPDVKSIDLTPPVRILCIQMELCSMNLRAYLCSCIVVKNGNPVVNLNVAKHLKIFEQITLGLRHIHKYGLIHRDLKPENIFFCKEDRTIVKIGDMGIAKVAEPTPKGPMTCTGTLPYMAPEQFTPTYGKEVDIYALGLILVELFVPQSELHLHSTIMDILTMQKVPEELDKAFPALAQLARKLTESNPSDRPSYNVILKTVQNYGKEILKLPNGTNAQHKMTCFGCHRLIEGIRHRCSSCADVDHCKNCWHNMLASTTCHVKSHSYFEVISCNKCLKDLNTGRVFAYLVCSQGPDEGKSSCQECFATCLGHCKEVDKVVVDEWGQELDRYPIKETQISVGKLNSVKDEAQKEFFEMLLGIALRSGESSSSIARESSGTLSRGATMAVDGISKSMNKSRSQFYGTQ